MKLNTPIFQLKRLAKKLAREKCLSLHAALDLVANQYGFKQWSDLSAYEAKQNQIDDIFERLKPGNLMLIAARPRQGKTMLALELLLRAVEEGHVGYIFSLEHTKQDIWNRLEKLGTKRKATTHSFTIDTSDEISSVHIENALKHAKANAFVVIDYMQLLDQKRENPTLDKQIEHLADLARNQQHTIVLLSQVHRSFDLSGKELPTVADVRLPNHVDLNLFSHFCFLHMKQIGFA